MATLHMDPDAVRGCSSTMRSSADQIQTTINNVKSNADSVVGSAWQGGSALQFQGELQALNAKIVNAVQEVQQLAARLDQEVAQWEQTASSF